MSFKLHPPPVCNAGSLLYIQQQAESKINKPDEILRIILSNFGNLSPEAQKTLHNCVHRFTVLLMMSKLTFMCKIGRVPL